MKKTPIIALILALALVLPLAVTAAEPRMEGYYQVEAIPASWNPMEEGSPDADLILSLTADRLYHLSPDGRSLTPSLAAGLPQDVTAEYAGSLDIPADAVRGYAFRIDLEFQARWEDGSALTSEDLAFTIRTMEEEDLLHLNFAELAAAEDKSGPILSLKEAGFSSLEEAQNAGYTEFYVDTLHFWGLDTGWVSVTDRSRLVDTAIPSGITEMYISGAYLFSRYLGNEGSLAYLQADFLGIRPGSHTLPAGEPALLTPDNRTLVLVLCAPTTPEALATKLSAVIPVPAAKFAGNYATSPAIYRACGPWRIASLENGVMELVPNEYCLGKIPGFTGERIYLKEIGS